ncbi:MAG TPA: hypothetical protein VE338_01075 [Ktedonobacterales bacterium]|nr:hypothetical protein [Ktedonobacterales bacterium]
MSERAAGASVAAPRPSPAIQLVAVVGYAPITRVDAERREIELCATSEALDAHGTIFEYAASKAAFTRWLGNVREMHERRAVGRRVAVRCDDETRRVYVRLRISRGAQDTWEKVLDGTLRGASIGASDVVWRRERRNVAGRSRWVNVATRYDLAELSLVDNPSNPDALGVTFVRDATPDVTLLDPLEPLDPLESLESSSAPDASATVEEEGGDAEEARAEVVGERTADAAHVADAADTAESGQVGRERMPLHEATRALLAGCACPRCEVALAALGANDESAQVSVAADAADAAQTTRAEALTRALAAGLQANAARLARFDRTLSAAVEALRVGDTRRMAPSDAPGDATGDAPSASQADQVVEELRARVARLEAQPVGGGPAARAVEKTLGGAPGVGGMSFGGADDAGAEYRALEALAGRLRDPQAQLAVAAEMIRLQQRAE